MEEDNKEYSFDDALNQSQEMVNTEQQSAENPSANENQEPQVNENGGQQQEISPEQTPQNQTENAVQAMEQATRQATEQYNQNQQLQQQLQQQQQVIAQLQEQIKQQNAQQEESLVNGAMPEQSVPCIDFDNLMFADEAERKAATEQYTKNVADYTRQSVLAEIQPLMEQFNQAKQQQEFNDMVNILSTVPQFADLPQNSQSISRIIATNPMFVNSSSPIEEKIAAAYAMAKGASGLNKPPSPEPTAEELWEKYKDNKDFINLVNQKNAELIRNSNGQQVPPMSAGAGNMALNIPDKPKTFDDAKQRAASMFR